MLRYTCIAYLSSSRKTSHIWGNRLIGQSVPVKRNPLSTAHYQAVSTCIQHIIRQYLRVYSTLSEQLELSFHYFVQASVAFAIHSQHCVADTLLVVVWDPHSLLSRPTNTQWTLPLRVSVCVRVRVIRYIGTVAVGIIE
jgi:hypothetical protein